jgi:hypothetical protein
VDEDEIDRLLREIAAQERQDRPEEDLPDNGEAEQ